MKLPAEFLTRMRGMLGAEYDDFLKSYDSPVQRAIRVNTLKISIERFREISPFGLEQVGWEKCGFYVNGDGLGKTVYHAAGLYYVQEASAMCAAPKLEVVGGERILDLCSAPGGKGTQLAQYTGGKGFIFLNEINYSRAVILCSNAERLGIKNAVITCASPEKLSCSFKEYFDKILVDAPCSGEGMFKKEEAAIPEWSVENVLMCAKRQADILESTYKMLAVGGRIVYSTCTFSAEEDEQIIGNFLKIHPDCKLISMDKLYPHKVRGEGHFAAVIQKNEGVRRDIRLFKPAVADKKLLTIYNKWAGENLKVTFNNLHTVGRTLYSLPDGMPETNVQMLRAGVRLGEFADNRFEPSHSLAMCLKEGEAEGIETDEKTALSYLRGLTFDCDEKVKGWRLVLYKGFPLGWCKASGGTAKNKLPKGLRI